MRLRTRHTKIISTIGPSSCNRATIADLIAAGTDVARLNFSHGTHDAHRQAAAWVREEGRRQGRQVSLLQDLQGPRIRVGRIAGGSVLLQEGSIVVLTPKEADQSTADTVHISYDALADDVAIGGRILIDNGLLELRAVESRGSDVVAEVIVGGELRSSKGVNLPRVRTTGPALTRKDLIDLEVGIEIGVDFVALSFVRDESDVVYLRRRIVSAGHRANIIAKIEKPEAVSAIDAILAVSDGIMVARGDLGIEMPMEDVPWAQKTIIHKCLEAGKPVITATQMIESMIDNLVPTRAEASDVANAVLDGTDAVMLSGETAVGRHPAAVVEAMSQIITSAEEHWDLLPTSHRGLPALHRRILADEETTEAVSSTAFELADQVGATAIACLTGSGATARSIARHRPRMPIYAFTDEPCVVGQLGILWGTTAFTIPFQHDTDEGVRVVQQSLLSNGLVRRGDLIVVTAGMPLPRKGRTNMILVSRID